MGGQGRLHRLRCAGHARAPTPHIHPAPPACVPVPTTRCPALPPPAPPLVAQGVTVSIPPLNYLFVHTYGTGKYCIALFDGGGYGAWGEGGGHERVM